MNSRSPERLRPPLGKTPSAAMILRTPLSSPYVVIWAIGCVAHFEEICKDLEESYDRKRGIKCER